MDKEHKQKFQELPFMKSKEKGKYNLHDGYSNFSYMAFFRPPVISATGLL